MNVIVKVRDTSQKPGWLKALSMATVALLYTIWSENVLPGLMEVDIFV